jgi:tripartite-type tricarboxylate transporter receptor subunit TctC
MSGINHAAKLAAVLFMLGLAPMPAMSQSAAGFPDRPIKLIVPYPPGGSTDPVARLLAQEIQPKLGQPVVVDNRAGAAGSIGTEAVARAAPDGYTILLHTSVISTDPTLKKNIAYDVKRDLTPITLAVTGPYLVVVNPSLPVKNIAELIAYAKANPGKLFYGSAGQGSSGHLIGELFKMAAGIDMTHVPYKGGGPSITGLMGNEVQVLFDTIGGSRSLAESGKLRAIAVTSPARSPVMPTVPTVSESGLKDFARNTGSASSRPRRRRNRSSTSSTARCAARSKIRRSRPSCSSRGIFRRRCRRPNSRRCWTPISLAIAR